MKPSLRVCPGGEGRLLCLLCPPIPSHSSRAGVRDVTRAEISRITVSGTEGSRSEQDQCPSPPRPRGPSGSFKHGTSLTLNPACPRRHGCRSPLRAGQFSPLRALFLWPSPALQERMSSSVIGIVASLASVPKKLAQSRRSVDTKLCWMKKRVVSGGPV